MNTHTTNAMDTSTETAILGGGCFWCIESDFEKLDGVLDVQSGYSGGHVPDPAYKQVSTGITGHVEVIQVVFDPQKLTYEKVLDYFYRHIDPTDGGGQFCDRGEQYRPVVFTLNDTQKQTAQKVNKVLEEEVGKVFDVDILPAKTFYPAEGYHQNYAKRNPIRYKYYRFSCGRDQRVKEVWKK